MRTSTFTPAIRKATLPSLMLGLALLTSACSDDTTTTVAGPDPNRTFNQVQRLGNPLISEVLLEKRDHPLHGSIGPDQDLALVAPKVLAFLTGPGSVAGRDPAYANVLGGALMPDMLVVQTDKDPTNSGWLTWLPLAPFTNGWGGRKLDDDVVDLALLAVFGDPFNADPTHTTPSLTTDNVASDSPITATFPYLAPPNL
jgi:hypothetical protein